ncbi:hypothetical protein Goshw_010541, partial [Gossypium schwendimanii]|nr:hypothetical protein [Gossypium schwendimanii]
ILTHLDVRKRVDIFALSIYGLVVFPKALGHVDEVVIDLFDQLDKRVTPIPAILAETFRSLSACRKAREGRFIGYAQLLLVWFYSYFWKDIKWKAPWLVSDEILYRYGNFDWVPLLGIWGAVGYVSLLVLRWEQKFQEVQTRNEALEKSLSESQKEKGELKDRVTELERSLRQY